MTQGKAGKRAAREARLEKALRENLKRRRAQARGRTEEERAAGETGEAEDKDEETQKRS